MDKNIIDDGFSSELISTASFAGSLEIPILEKPEEVIMPEILVPFSKRNRAIPSKSFVCFYENDIYFRDVLTATSDYIDELKQFAGVISPDCSLYWDMPLCLQIANIYMNRAVAYHLQQNGVYVIPNVRWGDERTFTTEILPEKVAFLGIPKRSIVSVGTYGCVKSREEQKMFRAGLIAMLDELEPEIVLVYGSMPNFIFYDLLDRTQFVRFPDWISYKKGGLH